MTSFLDLDSKNCFSPVFHTKHGPQSVPEWPASFVATYPNSLAVLSPHIKPNPANSLGACCYEEEENAVVTNMTYIYARLTHFFLQACARGKKIKKRMCQSLLPIVSYFCEIEVWSAYNCSYRFHQSSSSLSVIGWLSLSFWGHFTYTSHTRPTHPLSDLDR